VDHASAEFEQLFARIAVAPVLLDGIFYRLLCKVILEFERRDRQAVGEQR
jgi:hypothetical protein